MTKKILQVLKHKDITSIDDLCKELNSSYEQTRMVMDYLEYNQFIQRIQCSQKTNCDDCRQCSGGIKTERNHFKIWVLTNKGKKFSHSKIS